MKDKWNMTFLLFQSNLFFLILGLMEPDFYLTSHRKQQHGTGIAQNVCFDIISYTVLFICVFLKIICGLVLPNTKKRTGQIYNGYQKLNKQYGMLETNLEAVPYMIKHKTEINLTNGVA